MFEYLLTRFITSYMRYKTRTELDFKYNQTIIYPDTIGKKLLYLHIPFCQNLCPYCSFHKYIFQKDRAKEYFKYLQKEIKIAKNKGFEFNSLYIGGGTPTLLPNELADTIDLVRTLWDIQEVSCEADPNVSFEAIFLKDKIDRLSVGIQSFNNKILKQTKRYKKFGSAQEQFIKLEKIIENFKMVNCDLIFSFPKQTKEELLYDLKMIKQLFPNQISIYPLMHSPSVKRAIEKNMGQITSNNEYKYYKLILNELSSYQQISCWSFANKQKDIFDEYVVDYDEYLGLGSGAFSYIKDTLYINYFALDKYKNAIKNDLLSIQRYKQFKRIDYLYYRLMLSLFGLNFNKEQFYKKYNLHDELDTQLKLLQFFKIIDNNYSLTMYGKYIFMLLMKEFYIGMDYVREISRKGIDKYGISI